MSIVTESLTLSEPDAIQAAALAGYVVAELQDNGLPEYYGSEPDFAAACAHARRAARREPGKVFGVFKLVRDFRSTLEDA